MNISIYQIQYSNDIVGTFDPSFLKYDCRNNPEPDKREVAHMLRFYDENVWKEQGSEYFGLLSPKFSSKAGISGSKFIDWIKLNPGYDVYFINPFPQLSFWNYNVWTQGEFWHPGLTKIANSLFTASGFSFKVEDLPRNTISSSLYSNYWVGNEKFWKIYMNFINQIVLSIDNLNKDDKNKIYENTAHYTSATFFPFIFERLFSTFLVLNKDIKYLSYEFKESEILSRCDNDMEKFIVSEWADMINEWDKSDRNDIQYKKLLINLSKMLIMYQSDISKPCNPSKKTISIFEIYFSLKKIFTIK